MHHYGEMEVKVKLIDQKEKGTFNIILTNRVTGAEITVAGPTKGVFETTEHTLDHVMTERLGREIAHTLRNVLSKSEGWRSIAGEKEGILGEEEDILGEEDGGLEEKI